MAGKTVKEVVTKWGFQVDKKPLEDMKKSVAGLKANLMQLGVAAAANALAIFGFAESTAHAANEVRLSALRTGLSTKAYQELSYAAKQSGVGTEEFTHAMMFLNRNMYAARTGSKEAARAFGMLGGDVASAVAHGRNGQEVFKLMANKFQAIKDPAKAGALSMQIFGRAGAQLLPLLKQGSAGIDQLSAKAEELGLVFDDETIEASHEFHMQMEELKGSIIGFKNVVGASLIKPVGDIIRAANQWISVNRKFINSQVKEFFNGVRQSLGAILIIFSKIGQMVAGVAKAFGGLGSALRIVLSLFTAIKLLGFLSSLGGAVMALSEMAAAWKYVGNSAMLANLKMTAIPILIGAAVVLAIAAIEDLVGTFQGKNSLGGYINDWLAVKFPAFFEGMSAVIGFVGDKIVWLIDKVSTLVGWFTKFPTKVAGIFDFTSQNNTSANAGPGGPSLPNALNSGVATNNNNAQSNVNVTAPITVTVPAGTPPHEVGDRVHEGVQKGIEQVLRPAHRALSAGEAY